MARKKTINPVQDTLSKFNRLPQAESVYEGMRKAFGSLAGFYGFEKIFISPLENPRTFLPLQKVGLFNERPLLVLKGKTGDGILLRPAGTLGVLQAYITHKMNELPHPLKFWVEAESFFSGHKEGAEIAMRPEFGFLIIGEDDPVADAEILQVVWRSLEELGAVLEELIVRVNATGCGECRSPFRSALGSYFRNKISRLCRNCKKQLKTNPTNIFLCQEEKCRALVNNTPAILDFLCEACKKYLREFLEFLDEVGIIYLLDARFFKKESWYSTIIFELSARASHQDDGEQNKNRVFILAEGGHLTRPAEILAGKRIEVASAVVFLDTLEAFFSRKDVSLARPERPKVFLTQLGDLAKKKSLSLLEMLRKGGIEVKESLGRDAIKSQFKVAEHMGAKIALILGQKEALDKTVIVRDIDSGIQETISQDKLIDFLKRRLEG